MWLMNVFRNFWRKKRADAELDEEVRGYVEMLTDEKVSRGTSAMQARWEAKMEMGGVEQVKERTREVRAGHFLETLWQDIRFGARMLRKSPGFTAVAVLTLALGISANTAIFSVLDATMLKPLPYSDPSSIAIVWESLPKYGILHNTVSPPNFFDWQKQNRVFSGMAAFLDQPLNLTGAGDPEQVSVEMVSANFFSVLGVDPMFGRGFAAAEDQQGKSNVVVLSYGLWKARFGADAQIVGKTIQLNGEAKTVIGVMGPQFHWYIREFSFTHSKPQLWTPLVLPPEEHDWSKAGRFLRVVARLGPSVTMPQAQSQMNVVAANLAARHPKYDKDWGITVTPVRVQLSENVRTPLLILLGAVGLVLLIACANLSNLLLSRAIGRKREIAIRLALGAGKGRIVRQLITESMLLGIVGGVLGAICAFWATKALAHSAEANLLGVAGISADWRVLAFAAGITILAGLLAGIAPSWISARSGSHSALPEGARGASAGAQSLAMRSILVVTEMALAIVLLAGASLLIQSFYRLTRVDPGFHIAHLLTFRTALPDSKYPNDTSRTEFYHEVLGRIRQLPGVQSATAEPFPPFSGPGAATDFSIVGEAPAAIGDQHGTDVRVIEPDYFRTMQIPLLKGRVFTDREFSQAEHVVIINKSFAEQFFSGKNPIGQKVVIDMKDQNVPTEIVGVVGDVHEASLRSAPDPIAYWPYPELPYSVMTFIVRTPRAPLAMVPSAREAVQEIDKDQPIADVSSMEQLVSNSTAGSRFTTLLLGLFAAAALALAAIGIYGVMSYSVLERTHEIGIRLALGAQRRDIFRLIVGRGTKLACVGVVIGIAAALGLTRLMSALLFGVGAEDPATFVAVAIVLGGVALLACYIPARRAMGVDPMVALRYE